MTEPMTGPSVILGTMTVPMTGPAGPRYEPGLPAAATELTVPKRSPFTLAHLRAVVAQADQLGLSPGAVVTHTASMGGKLRGLKVEDERAPAANDPLTAQ
jgi:hypothetical protein